MSKGNISPTQQRILDLMANGWELGMSQTLHHRVWIQEGGLGRGGKSLNVSWATFSALYRKGLIRRNYERSFPIDRYKLVTT